MRRQRRFVDGLVAVLLVALALTPLVPAFGGSVLVAPCLAGLAAGGVLAGLATWRRWPILVLVASLVVAYIVLGSMVVVPHLAAFHFLPSLASLRWLAIALTGVWARVVTVEIPLGKGDGLTDAPFLLALIGAAVAVALATRLRPRRAPLAILAALVIGTASVVLGARPDVPVPLLPLALTFGLVALVWTGYRSGTWQPRRGVAIVVTLALIGGAGFGGYLLGEQRERLVVREQVEPPFDAQRYPSPLAGYRRYVKELRNEPLVTATGLPSGALIRFAVMDTYDGTVWNVAGSDQSVTASGEFRRMAQDRQAGVSGEAASVSLQIEGDAGTPWLYSVGMPTAVTFAGSDANANREAVRLNTVTGALALTEGQPAAATYTVDAVVSVRPADDVIAQATAVTAISPVPLMVPDTVGPAASAMIQDVRSQPAGAQALKLEDKLSREGYFSHGQAGEGNGDDEASPAGHGADRMAGLIAAEYMVGDGEQYASLMALMARSLGLDARVVMGFDASRRPSAGVMPGDEDEADVAATPAAEGEGEAEAQPEVITFTGQDMQVWVEINLAGLGWVAFFPTPQTDQSKLPEDTEEDPAPNPVPVPPEPPQPTPSPPPDSDTDAGKTDTTASPEPEEETAFAVQPWMYSVAAGTAVLAIVVLALLLVVAAKHRRSRRRETTGPPGQRIMGGWDEMLDRLTDLREPLPQNATRIETAALVAPEARNSMAWLAREADAAAFSGGLAVEAQAVRSWDWVREAHSAVKQRHGLWTRLRAATTRRSLKLRKQQRKAAAKAAKQPPKPPPKPGSKPPPKAPAKGSKAAKSTKPEKSTPKHK